MRKTIGGYQLLGPLGSGGMGMVFRAEHLQTGKKVALKTVKTTDESLLRSIRREIQALARLKHPGIVAILEEGVEEGIPWYAMELLDGQDLRRWLQSFEGVSPLAETARALLPETQTGLVTSHDESLVTAIRHSPVGALEPLTSLVLPEGASARLAKKTTLSQERLSAVATLVKRLCEPLSFLHGEGITHRDIKPENILILKNKVPVLVDFGVASQPTQSEQARENLLVEAAMVGTIYYMSPEQIRREVLDARADLYSLGVLLFELLTGQRPFIGSSPLRIIEGHLTQSPPRLTELLDGVPLELDSLVFRLLAKERRERPGYAADVANALAPFGEEDLPAVFPKTRAYLYRPTLSGREEPLARLRAHLAGLAEGRGGLVLLGGESGVGKTRLLAEIAREQALKGQRVLSGECQDLETKPALSALRRPLQSLVDACREKGKIMSDLVFGRRGKALSLYEPSISHLPGQELYLGAAELSANEARQRLFSYLRETLLAYAGGKPLLLVLDDLQWVDALSLAFLQFLLRGAQTPWLLVIGTYRIEEVTPSLHSLLQNERVESLMLQRLNQESVAHIIGDMLALSPPPLVLSGHLMRHSEGNPFFVAEYLRSAVEEGLLFRDADGKWQLTQDGDLSAASPSFAQLVMPGSLRELVGRRLERLTAEIRGLLEAAALVGREMPTALLEEISGMAEEQFSRTLRELLKRQILEEREGERVRFAHDKLREVSEERALKQGDSKLYQRVAEALEKVLGEEKGAYLAQLGWYWERAGAPEKARRYYVEAARRAVQTYAYEDAERLYRAALSLFAVITKESVDLRGEMVMRALQARGKVEESSLECERALAEARTIRDGAGEAQSLRRLGVLRHTTGRVEEALPLIEAALSLSRQLGEKQIEMLALSNLVVLLREQGELTTAVTLYQQGLQLARQLGSKEGESVFLGSMANMCSGQGQIQEALTLYEQALGISREIGSKPRECAALSNLALLHRKLGHFIEAEAFFEQSLQIAREISERRSEGWTLDNLAALRCDQGRFIEAEALHEQALHLAREIEDKRLECEVLGNIAALSHKLGQLEKARALFEPALQIAREIKSKHKEGTLLRDLAALSLFDGQANVFALIEQGESLIQASDSDKFELAKAICIRGHAKLALRESAADCVERARALAVLLQVTPPSELGVDLAALVRAQSYFARGLPLVCGYCQEDLLEGQLLWLQKHQPKTLQ